MIRIHNSLTGEKQELRPLEPGHVRMYSCGVTVYDYFHVGNARMLVVFDMVSRYLRHRGLRVTYVRNITDVDDKIINRAREAGVDWREHARKFTAAMHEDLDRLGCLRPEREPKASEYIDDMLAMIGQLVANGYAYQAGNGDVMYDVHKFAPYGKLSGKRLEDLRAGARVEVDSAKRDPLDFVLWKSAKPGEPAWPSPFGEGRPGWHIECSAMSTRELGEHFDIHGGGLDLKFPHHENEIAQTCGATGGKFAEIWMHNGFLNIDNEKMSKSLGNFFTTREVIREVGPEVLRIFLLSSHYRGPMNYSREMVAQAKARLDGLCRPLVDLSLAADILPGAATEAFVQAMDDDFNTPEALSVLNGLAKEVNRLRQSGEVVAAGRLGAELRALGDVLGVLPSNPQEYFQRLIPPPNSTSGSEPQIVRTKQVIQPGTGGIEMSGQTPLVLRVTLSAESIQSKIDERLAARRAKNWAESDRIREELASAGVILEDKPGGVTTWRRS